MIAVGQMDSTPIIDSKIPEAPANIQAHLLIWNALSTEKLH